MFHFLSLKQLCLKSQLYLKKKGWVGEFTVKWNIPGLSEIMFLKKFGKAVSLSWRTNFFYLSWRVKASGDYFDKISICVLQKERCSSWSFWLKSSTENWSSFSQILSATLGKVFFHSLYKLFCCYFNSFRALPLTSILNDEQSDSFSLTPNSHWLFCH